MGAVLSFLGGSAFRMIWGEVSSYFSKKQDHKFEQQRMLLQGKLDSEQHARQLESVRLNAELGIKTIEVQRDADVAREEARAWAEATALARTPTGIKWVDAWNGAMRPAFYTLALFIVLLICFKARWQIAALQAAGIIDLSVAIIGFLYADRSLLKRGK